MFQVYNPYTQELLAEYQYSTNEEIDKTIATLKDHQSKIAQMPVYQRVDVLFKLKSLLSENKEKLATLVVQETGKTITDALIEIDRAISTIEATAAEIRSLKGETLPSDAYPPNRQKLGITDWKPLGLIYCITPFNFPINIAMHKIAPAFAAGNAILYKASEYNYLSSQFLLELCYQAGIPKEVLQPIYPSPDQHQKVNQDSRINAINFTGGSFAGKLITQQAGIKPLLMELGGNDPLIVCDDGDLTLAVQVAIQQRFGTAGQRCTAPKRFFVHKEVKTSFIDALVEASKSLIVGDPMNSNTFTGPLIHQQAALLVEARIKEACSLGAKCLLGGQREASIIWPTILDDVPPESSLVHEETFGPVIPIQTFSELNDLPHMINSTDYGLQAGVFTESLSTARWLHDSLDVGALIVNDGPGFRAEHFPFGGVKASGIGREGAGYAIRAMSQAKLLVI